MFIKLPRWVVAVIYKINAAWEKSYVEYWFNKTCEDCATKGLCNHCNCDKCALKIAHDKAITEIDAGLRKPLERTKRGCYVANNAHGTQVMNCHNDNPKERAIKSMNEATTFEELKTTRLNYCAKCSKYPNCTNCTVKHTFENNTRRFI